MAITHRAAVVLLVKELSNDSILKEAISCEDEEFLSFLLIREQQSHVCIENYFERIKPLYSVSDFWSHFYISRTTVSCLEYLLATCPGLPHGLRNGGRPTIDLQKQVLIIIWILGNPECLCLVGDQFNITKSMYFVFSAEFVERLTAIFPVNIRSTYLFEIEHCWEKWLISNPLPKGTHWINDPMIHLQIVQISDPINPCPEWIW